MARNIEQRGSLNKAVGKPAVFRLKPTCAALLLVFAAQSAQANPAGGAVIGGQASFATSGNTLTVTNTPGAVIHWQSFSIGANEVTRFAQQSAASTVLNRVVTANNPSNILGTLSSNGRVFLVNPGGVIFGKGATVDVAGLVATTLKLSDADFQAGRYHFADVPGAQSISNAGDITAHSDRLGGGQIYLIAPDVKNTGVIKAPNGEILLAAGHEVQLVNSLDPHLRANITAPAGDATNIGTLVAEAGSLGLFGAVVRNSGTASADSTVSEGGKIVFKASRRVEIGGTVTANSTALLSPSTTLPPLQGESRGGDGVQAEGVGGTIRVLGNEVGIMGGATVSASGTLGGGTVFIGGDYQGKNSDVQNAQATYVAPTATISADATDNGNGGKVIAWADDTTRAYGTITARGGANGGNGGFIETSGKQYLDVAGIKINTAAPSGVAGNWLLDPTDITIVHGTATGGAIFPGTTFDNGGATTATLNDFDINANLASNNIIITTTSAALGVGDIKFDATGGSVVITNGSGGARTLTLAADNDIVFSGGSATFQTTAGGSLVINFNPGTTRKVDVQSGATALFNGSGGGAVAAYIGGANGKTWENSGTVTLSGVSLIDLNFGATSTFNNNAGGILNLGSTQGWAIQSTPGAQAEPINNAGTVNVTAGTSIEAAYSQSSTGTLNIAAAGPFLNLQNANVIGGTINIGAGSSLSLPEVHSGARTFSGATIINAGTLSFAALPTTFSNTTLSYTGGTGNYTIPTGIIYNGSVSYSATGNLTLSSAINTTGNVILNADSDGSNSGAIVMNTGSSITSNGGNITLGGGAAGNGTGNADGNATYLNGIYLTGATLNAGGGNIALNGTGFAGTSLAHGVYVTDTSSIQTTGTGTITLNGTGGAGVDDNNGVRIGTNSSITAVNGLISLTGQGGASTGTWNLGIYAHNGATVASTGTGGITLNGTGGSSGATNHNTGIAVHSGATVSVVDGALALIGTSGAGTGTYNRGVNIQQGTVRATGLGGISITGYSNATAASSFGRGVELREGGLVQSASGAINITGGCLTGSCGLGTSSNEGIYLHDATTASGFGAGKVLSTSGAITLTGSNWGTGASNYGIHLFNDTALSSALSAAVDTGAGGDSNISLVSTAGDILLDAGAVLGANTSGNLLLNAGRDLIVGTALTRTAAGSADFRANNNILFSATGSFAPSAGAVNVSLNSNYDGGGGGGIYLGTGSFLSSNDGDIWVGGQPSTGYAIGNGTVTGGIPINNGITVRGSITAGAGNVTMRGQGATGWTALDIGPVLSAGSISLSSSGGDILLNDLSATATGLTASQNAIAIQSVDRVNSAAMNATSGSILIAGDAGVDLDANDWTPTILAQAGNVSISSANGDVMASYWANITGQNIAISAAGAVNDGDIYNYGTVTANALTVTAGAGINLHTAADSLATTNTGTGDTAIANTGALTVGNMSDAGTITLTSDATLSQATGTAISANILNVTTSGGIALTTQVASLTASNTVTGDIVFTNTGALNILGTTQGSGGSLTIANSGALSVTGAIGAGNGAVALSASGALSDISITGTGGVNTSGGTISLNAGQDIIHTGGAQQINSSSGAITLAAGRDIVHTNAAQINSFSGALLLNAGRDILHTGSTTGQINTFNGAVTLMAGRDIIHADANQINSYSGAILLSAGRNIAHSGSASQINNNDGSLTITAGQDFIHSASNQINTNSGALHITAVRDFLHSASGQVNTSSGAMTIGVGGNFLYTGSGQINAASSAQTITAGGNLDVSGASSQIRSGGNQTVSAGRDISVGPSGGLIATSGMQTITAGRDMSVTQNNGSAYIESGGLQTITVGRNLLVQVTNSSGLEAHIEGDAGQTITVGGDLTLNALDNDQTRINANGGNQTITVGGNMLLNAAQDIAHVQSLAGTQTVTVSGNLNLTGSDSYMTGSLGQTIAVGGNLDMISGDMFSGGSATLQIGNGLTLSNDAGVWSNGSLYGSVGGNVTITGDISGNYTGLFGSPDIGSATSPFRVGGTIHMDDGVYGGAQIHSDMPTSIWIHFPNLTSGGYFVNGTEQVSSGMSGFYAGGSPAVLDSNLHITYMPLAIISQPVLDFIAQSSIPPLPGITGLPANVIQPPNINLLLAAAPPGAGDEPAQDDPALAALAAAAPGPDPAAPPPPLPVCK